MPQEVAPASENQSYEDDRSASPFEDGMRVAAFDLYLEDLSDPAVLARYARAEILIVSLWQIWQQPIDLSLIRAANPDIKILGFFRSKCIRSEWSNPPSSGSSFTHDLYLAGQDYLCYTTTGDTLSDWPNALVVDYTQPAARKALLEVFARYQAKTTNKLDGVYWDYFTESLWISPDVRNMTGEPDMDGDGVPHWEDDDEIQAFIDGQDAFVDEMRAKMGEDFIQVANGIRAKQDSTFAAKLDGMFYEGFPTQSFLGGPGFRMALDPANPNNLWAARSWPRTKNGGPWLILSHMWEAGRYLDENGDYQSIDADDFTRAVALLTDCTAVTWKGFNVRDAGIPEVEYNLGKPMGGTVISGSTYSREFENGRLELFMGFGDYPVPFEFTVTEGGRVIHDLDLQEFLR